MTTNYAQMVRELNPTLFANNGDLIMAKGIIVERGNTAVAERLAAAGYEMQPDSIYTFSAESSNDGVDSYFSHMHRTTLANFARGSETGVSLLDSHDSRKLGIGYSCGGRLVEEGGRLKVITDFYIVRGLNYGAGYSYATSDDFIKAIESGVVRDVSVGLYGGRHVCDIDGQNIWSWDCHHFPGQTYNITDPETGEEKQVTCTYTIYDATLAEVSVVYDGATPAAMILKGADGVQRGLMTPDALASIARTARCTIRLPAQGDSMNQDDADSNATPRKPGDAAAPVRAAASNSAGLREGFSSEMLTLLMSLGASEDMGDEAAVRHVVSHLQAATNDARNRVTDLEARLSQMADDAAANATWVDRGHQYHAELIDRVVAAGIRSQGNLFPSETYRQLLATASVEHLLSLADGFEASSDIPHGRRIDEGANARNAGGANEAGDWQPKEPAAVYS